jgi:hypothetical protein
VQLSFSFDQGMRVEKTLVQTRACQVSPSSVWAVLYVVTKKRLCLGCKRQSYPNLDIYWKSFLSNGVRVWVPLRYNLH